MIESIFKALRLGRSAMFTAGLAVALALVFGGATAALAAVPGDPFRLGRINPINRMSQLVGGTTGAMLRIDNNGAGSALELLVEPKKPPLTVNATAGKATNLNADKLDDMDSTELFTRRTSTYEQFGEPVYGSGGGTLVPFVYAYCDPNDKVVGGGGFANDGDDDLVRSSPTFTQGSTEAWEVSFQDNGAAGYFRASALCVDFPPFRT
jgi:hypothetical protein